jgi:DNA-binding CsgD family transcriptional regulator
MRTIVGRERELATIAALLEGQSQTRALRLEGEAGIGKTTVWREGVRLAAERGYRVLRCEAASSEAQFAFAGLRDLCADDFAGVADDLPDPQRRALRVVLLLDEPGAEPPDGGAISVAFLTMLRSLASRGPTLVAIDDVQWLDPATAAVLSFVIRRLPDQGLFVLLARRVGDEPDPVPPSREDQRTEVLTVAGLTVGALGRILRSRLGLTYTRRMLQRLHQASDGNPLYALELAHELAGSDAPLRPGEAIPIPPGLRDLVRRRLRALPDETLDALAIAAALGHPSVRLVGEALGANPLAPLSPAEVAEVMSVDGESIRFAHPLFAAAVLELVGPARRREIHRRLADSVPDLEQRARHLAMASERPDEDVAAAVEEGAQAAFGRGAPGSGAELMELAIRVTPATAEGPSLARRAELARFHLVAGNLAEAADVLTDLVERLPAGGARADALLMLAEASELREVSRSHEFAMRALADAHGDDVRTARVECYISNEFLFSGVPAEGVKHARAALEAAERACDAPCLKQALTMLAWHEACGWLERDPSITERALALEEEDGSSGSILESPSLILGLQLMYEGRLEEARARLEQVRTRATSTGDETGEATLRIYLTELECRAGRLELAREHASGGYHVAELIDADWLTSGLLYACALADAHLGMVDEARHAARRGVALANRCGADKAYGALNLSVLGFLELSVGDYAAADGVLRPLVAQIGATSWREPAIAGELPNAIEALVELGELAEADQLLAELEGRLSAIESPWGVASAGRCRGMILAAKGDHRGALAAYEQALATHEGLPQPFDHARTLLALGKTQRRAKQRRAARETLQRVLVIFGEVGATLWVDKTRAELARISGRPAATGELTETEGRIAALVAEGLSNKEIATALFVTPKTVGTQLSRIYRKVGVHSRTQLARHLSREDDTPKVS